MINFSNLVKQRWLRERFKGLHVNREETFLVAILKVKWTVLSQNRTLIHSLWTTREMSYI